MVPCLPPFCMRSIPYSLEVMKGGALLGSLDLSERSFYTFGRVPTNDVVLDHPSSSRWVGGQLGGQVGKAMWCIA